MSYRPVLRSVAVAVVAALLTGCSAPKRMTDAKLESLGVRVGAAHWDATSRLSREGYACFVAGAKREEFDCSKTVGFFVTCILRVRFTVDDQNEISGVSVAEPACMGTP